jgi:hypothetical protein
MLPIRIARIFSDPSNRHELRVGAILVADAASFFRRFPSLELEGQLEAETSDIANAAIGQLNEVVKTLDRQPSALAGLIKTFAAARDIQDDAEFKAEVEKADKHLARVFQRLATDKRAQLPKPHGGGDAMRDRVAYARRSWKQPFADVTPQGSVELGAASPAVQIDVEALLPLSFAAYRDGMDGTIGKALRPLEDKYEAELDARAQTLADACVEQREEMQKLEGQLLSCAFGVKTCDDKTVEQTSASLDEAVASHDEMRARLEVALLELAQAPQGKLKQKLGACAR